MPSTSRAIIIAAGMGRRLEHHTEDRPKCLVEVAGKPILQHQLDAYRANQVDDFHIVRGYLAEHIVVPGAATYLNADFRTNNILFSLMHAEAAMTGPFLCSYSDIVFGADVVSAVLAGEGDITLVVDTGWARSYEGRHDHPVAQAELTEMDGARVARVGKQVGPENALGEFIGLAHFTQRGCDALLEAWHDVRARLSTEDPFHAARTFRQAYLTDMFLELIERGVHIDAAVIDGGWREIDTVEDLARVNEVWSR